MRWKILTEENCGDCFERTEFLSTDTHWLYRTTWFDSKGQVTATAMVAIEKE